MKIIPTLCCLFKEQPIKFKTFTIKGLEKLSSREKSEKIYNIYFHNIITLKLALDKCRELGIGSYRISSDLLPKYDYVTENNLLSDNQLFYFSHLLSSVNTKDIILSMHPDQFCVINSKNEDVVLNSVKILKYHLMLAELLGIDSINIHIGGVFGDKESSKDRFITNIRKYLTVNELKKITIENDERSYDILDILDICERLPLIRPTFDIHHFKCYNMSLLTNNSLGEKVILENIEYYLKKCKEIWLCNGFNYLQVHLSSPRDDRYLSLKGSSPHSDYIYTTDIIDFRFLDFDIVVDIEAKHKELAVLDFNKKLREVILK